MNVDKMNENNRMIYKYEIELCIGSIILMPKDAKILTLKVQNEKPCIWVEFDVENKDKLEERSFFLATTGNQFGPFLKYIDTFFRDEYVFHLYERILK